MIRSGIFIPGMLLFAASFSVNALTSNDFDPRDPAVWQEETVTPYPLTAAPCEVRSSPYCATWEDEKSDIQRERERREQRRQQNEYERYSRHD